MPDFSVNPPQCVRQACLFSVAVQDSSEEGELSQDKMHCWKSEFVETFNSLRSHSAKDRLDTIRRDEVARASKAYFIVKLLRPS